MAENNTFRCGHPRTAENSIGKVRVECRACRSAKGKATWAKTPYAARVLEYRVRNLPGQLERARMRVVHLEREAARLGLTELLGGGDAR